MSQPAKPNADLDALIVIVEHKSAGSGAQMHLSSVTNSPILNSRVPCNVVQCATKQQNIIHMTLTAVYETFEGELDLTAVNSSII